MSVLVFSLTAALVATDVPASVSLEVEEELILRGTWEGTWPSTQTVTKIKFSDQAIEICSGGGMVSCPGKVIDERGGKFRIELRTGRGKLWLKLLGIYRGQGDNLLLCIREESKGRPTSFRAGEANGGLILHRLTTGM